MQKNETFGEYHVIDSFGSMVTADMCIDLRHPFANPSTFPTVILQNVPNIFCFYAWDTVQWRRNAKQHVEV